MWAQTSLLAVLIALSVPGLEDVGAALLGQETLRAAQRWLGVLALLALLGTNLIFAGIAFWRQFPAQRDLVNRYWTQIVLGVTAVSLVIVGNDAARFELTLVAAILIALAVRLWRLPQAPGVIYTTHVDATLGFKGDLQTLKIDGAQWARKDRPPALHQPRPDQRKIHEPSHAESSRKEERGDAKFTQSAVGSDVQLHADAPADEAAKPGRQY